MRNTMFLTRTRHRVSQYVIAQRTGINQTRISLIENSFVTPRQGEMQRIADALLVKVGDLFPEVGNGPRE